MLFENITKILDMSKERDVDLLVARDMAINEEKEKIAEYNEASDVIKTYYGFVTKSRVAGDNDSIAKLCELYEAGDKEAIRELVKED